MPRVRDGDPGWLRGTAGGLASNPEQAVGLEKFDMGSGRPHYS